jgi:hypothetical protein
MALKSYCRLRQMLPLALLCLPGLWHHSLLAQGSGYLTVGEPSKVAGKRNASVEARIPVTVLPGYHVNSNHPSEEYLIPLKLTWTSTGALQPGTVTYPKANTEKYEFAEKPLSVFTGSFDLVANFKVAGNAPAGPGAAAGKLHYQACNNRACFAPKTVDVTVTYQIQ